MPENPKIISCQTASDYSQLLLDGRLSPKQRAQLDRHVAGCQSCAALVDGLRLDSRLLSEWTPSVPNSEPGDAFNAKIMAAIALETSNSEARSFNSIWQVYAFIALMSAVCVVAGYFAPESLLTQPFESLQSWLQHTTDLLPKSLNDWTGWASFNPPTLSTPAWMTIIGSFAFAANILFIARVRLRDGGQRHV